MTKRDTTIQVGGVELSRDFVYKKTKELIWNASYLQLRKREKVNWTQFIFFLPLHFFCVVRVCLFASACISVLFLCSFTSIACYVLFSSLPFLFFPVLIFLFSFPSRCLFIFPLLKYTKHTAHPRPSSAYQKHAILQHQFKIQLGSIIALFLSTNSF